MASKPDARGRFWGAEDSDDDDDRSDDDSQDAGAAAGAAAGAKGAAAGRGRFADLESDSESDDEKRVVRTAKDKKWDAMLSIIASLNKQLRADNWGEVEEGAFRLPPRCRPRARELRSGPLLLARAPRRARRRAPPARRCSPVHPADPPFRPRARPLPVAPPPQASSASTRRCATRRPSSSRRACRASTSARSWSSRTRRTP